MEHVLWIGGPPASGKTTIASRLMRRHGLRWYSADARTWVHRDRALRAGVAAAHRWEAMTIEDRWSAPPAEMLAMSLHTERGPMIVDDLRLLPPSPLVVAEGTTLPAAQADRARSVWLFPTPAFQRARLDERELPRGPRELFLALAEVIEREAREHGVTTLTIDETSTVEDTVAAVEELFAAALAAGTRAQSLAERRALLREANDAIVAQVRGYYARPWAEGHAESVVRTFVCECGDPTCIADVELPVGVVARETALAPGHAQAGGRQSRAHTGGE